MKLQDQPLGLTDGLVLLASFEQGLRPEAFSKRGPNFFYYVQYFKVYPTHFYIF